MRKQSQHVAVPMGTGGWSHRIGDRRSLEMKMVKSSLLLLALAAVWPVIFTVSGGSTPPNATIYDLWDSVSYYLTV